jgi:hypothetical protein
LRRTIHRSVRYWAFAKSTIDFAVSAMHAVGGRKHQQRRKSTIDFAVSIVHAVGGKKHQQRRKSQSIYY